MKRARKLWFTRDDSPTAPPLNINTLLKNINTLEVNYQGFQTHEKKALLLTVTELCRDVIQSITYRGIDGNMKLEDVNLLFKFYVDLKREFKMDFNNEIRKMIADGLQKFENDLVLNSNEAVVNIALKRLCVIWCRFYARVFPDLLICLNQVPIDVEQILLECFRDTIVLPSYKNFSNSPEGIEASFAKYIRNEEENGVTQENKLLLLQCFGILSSIEGKDMNQRVTDDLLRGVRLSM